MRISTSWRVLITLLATTANAHSWIEQLMVIGMNGTFVDSPGYPRSFVPRTSPDFNDKTMTHRLPLNGIKLTKKDNMCMDSQQQQTQSDGYPRLQAQQGSAIALRYQENGHVTQPGIPPGKPKHSGTVYVYGTANPDPEDKIIDIHKVWTEDGTGGDKRGRLLTTRAFDDGRCYQINAGNISQIRQKEFSHKADQLMGTNLWCQSDIKLPNDAASGKPYTLYWVWDWPTEPIESVPNGKPELYTTCMDVDVTGKADANTKVQAKFDDMQSLNSAAIPNQFTELFAPGSGSGSGSQGTASSSVVQSSAVLASSAVGASSVAAPSVQPSSSSPVFPASSAAVPSANQFDPPYRPTSSSAIATGPCSSPAMFAGPSSSAAMFAARPSSASAMFAAPSASSSVLNKYQQTGPSFVTRTKTVHQTHCSGE